MIQKVFLSCCIIACGMVYFNCGLHVKESFKSDQLLRATWSQPALTDQSIIPEFMLVLDHSDSMDIISARIQAAIIPWIFDLKGQGLEKMCIGVMRGVNASQETGRLVSAPGNQNCYCTFGPRALGHTDVAIKFLENFETAYTGANGSAHRETMIYSLTQALTDPAVVMANQADGCFSGQTTIVPILISDEQDISAVSGHLDLPATGINDQTPASLTSTSPLATDTFDNHKYLPAGVEFTSVRGQPYYNPPSKNEYPVRRDFHCKDQQGNYTLDPTGTKYSNVIDFESVAQDLIAFNGAFPSFGAAIGFYPENLPEYLPGPHNGEPFWGGKEFAAYFGASMLDLRNAVDDFGGNQARIDQARESFTADMNQLARHVAKFIAYNYQFDLVDPVCDSNGDGNYTDETVELLVDGVAIANALYTVENSGSRLIIDPSVAFQEGSSIELAHQPCL